MAELSWIAALLQYNRDGDDFCIRQPRRGATERLFGGLIAAQSLAVAGATVDDGKVAQSLHAYFVRGGRYTPTSSSTSTAPATGARSPPATSPPARTAR
ncbi:palmitoyl-CoA hydrolase [Mycolicibacterium conceptionense]|uniref:Palmitoyl-CoA hydrolase n=1 Tax=Mycolicibacterium conceptionense TaxID=451644 RepID=A0A0U1DWS3_9MYCO|nr:palmitoyl-CoA hydrolase [Mycolicibacterium conceptionense]